MGRLYYRQEVFARLTNSACTLSALNRAASDANLAIALYQALGCNGLRSLEGDFALALWDSNAREIIALRDPMGSYPLFWVKQGSSLLCGTNLNSIVQSLETQSLQPQHFAELLTPIGLRQEGPSDLTAYAGVQRVQPGQLLVINGLTGQPQRHESWNWAERCVAPSSTKFEEASQQYATTLRAAVQERLRGRTMSHLSGGIDSTGISLMARELIACGIGETPLHTVSLIFHRLEKLSRETPYAEQILTGLSDVHVHRIVGDDILNFDGFLDPPAHDEPFAGLWQIESGRALMGAAVEAGADTVLTGIGADEIHATGPYYLCDHMRRGKWSSAWKQATEVASILGSTPWRVLYPYGCEPFWQYIQLLRLGRRSFANTRTETTLWEVAPWISRDFALHYDLVGRTRANWHKLYGLAESVHLSVPVRFIQDRAGDFARWTLGAPKGVHLAHPFLDPRVISLGLGIRAAIPLSCGPRKPLLTAALKSLLPDTIKNRATKGHFDELYYLGLIKHQKALRELIADQNLNEFNMFDQRELSRYFEKALLGAVRADQLQQFDSTLSLLRWLSLRKDWLKQATAILSVRLAGAIHR